MYDTIKDFVDNLTFIMCVLGFVGFINLKINKPSENSNTTNNMDPEDLEKSEYARPETTESASTVYNTPPEFESSKTISPNILQQLGYSFLPHQYGKLATVKTGNMVGFVTLLSFVSILYILAEFIITFVVHGGTDTFFDQMPEFEFRNGILSIENDYVEDTGYIYVYLTDQIDGFGQDDVNRIIEQGYRNAILAGREKMILMRRGEYFERYYSELGEDFVLNKKIATEKLTPFLLVGRGIIYFLVFVGTTFWYFGCALFYFLAALLITTLLHRKMPARTLFRVAVYAKVPVFVIRIFWTAFYLSGFFRITITAGLMAFAIRHLWNSQNLQKLET